MSVNALAPKFGDKTGYLAWRKSWRVVYRELSKRIRNSKNELRAKQRAGDPNAGPHMKYLHLMRSDATKMMTLLRDAKDRWDRILSMKRDIEAQPFPIEITARSVDIHYNRGHNEFAFLPTWVVKVKGKSFYVDHIESTLPWSTRELETGSTKGMLRFRKCQLNICQERVATLTAAG